MILDLLAGGKWVGVTANSHKVISNLLTAVCDAADGPAIENRRPSPCNRPAAQRETHSHDGLGGRRAAALVRNPGGVAIFTVRPARPAARGIECFRRYSVTASGSGFGP